MIYFEDWVLTADPNTVIGQQYDNETVSLTVLGTFPDGWSWSALAQLGGNLNVINLSPVEGGIGVVLDADMLALSGSYSLQLKATNGDLVRHTNVVYVGVNASLSGAAQWPTVPSEFTQIEQNIIALNAHPPYPGDAGYWMVWDLETEAYVQSSLPLPPVAEGPPGKAATIKVGETVTGDPDTPAKVENTGTENAAVLRFTIPRGAVGPTGATPAISVEVTGLPAGAEPTVSVSGSPEAPVIALGIPQGKQGDPGGKGDPGQTPNITIGQVETLPPESPVTASITGETPNLVLNLGIPQGQQGDTGEGVPPADDVPTDYLLSVGGWVPPPSGGGAATWSLIKSVTTEEEVAKVSVDIPDGCKRLLVIAFGLYASGVSGYTFLYLNGSNVAEANNWFYDNNNGGVVCLLDLYGDRIISRYTTNRMSNYDANRTYSNQQRMGVMQVPKGYSMNKIAIAGPNFAVGLIFEVWGEF